MVGGSSEFMFNRVVWWKMPLMKQEVKKKGIRKPDSHMRSSRELFKHLTGVKE